MSIKRTLETITLDGGTLPFHFINTVRDRKVENVHDYLTCYDDIIIWSRRMNLMDKAELGRLQEFAKANSSEAEKAFEKAIDLRETMYNLFSAIAVGKQPETVIPEKFNSYLSKALSNVGISFRQDQYVTEIVSTGISLDKPVWLVLKDTYRLLLEDDKKRIKECQKCGWIFLDHTKNNTKIWCNPQICGSTSKSARYYHNKKASSIPKVSME
jgi:predicted RNA-binding Zn ribbon-like protein